MSASLIQKQTSNIKTKPTELAEPTRVGAVVQEYMDSLLVDLFPDIETPVESQQAECETELITPPVEQVQTTGVVDAVVTAPELETLEEQEAYAETQVEIQTLNKVKQESAIKNKLNLSDPLTQVLMQVASLIKSRKKQTVIIEAVQPDVSMQISTAKNIDIEPQVQVQEKIEAPINSNADVTIDVKADVTIESLADVEIPDTQVIDKIDVELPAPTPIQTPNAEPLKYPNAPAWAQEAFDVLLFDICGLKLAVPMESLGRIIKMEHGTNQLIGRPDWFLGAYTDADQHFYAVDTAAYIMPEQNIDLTIEDFGFLIQLQKTKWTLACQQVHTTVRLEPGDVKWRSQQGWFAGTLVEHMCTLLHVDSLVDTLEADSL